jgi:hypothetical protein
MYRGIASRMVLASAVASAALIGSSCDREGTQSAGSGNTAAQAPAPSPAPPAPQPINLTGCLQQGKGDAYILTALNEPKQPDSSKPAVVEREKVAAAREAYRLKADDSNELSKLVGHRIRVEGTLARRADLPAAPSESVGTSGQQADKKAASSEPKISQDDLAQVDVRSVQSIANACGAPTAKTGRRAKASSRSKR